METGRLSVSWSRFPNTATVYPVTQTTAAGALATIPAVGAGVAKKVDWQEMKPGDAVQDYGVELINPVNMYAPAADISFYPQGTRIVHDGITYEVHNSTVRDDGTGTNMSYTIAILGRVT